MEIIPPQNHQSGDDADYMPNWIQVDGESSWNLELPLSDDDLYPELDPLDPEVNVIIDPDDNPDYINQEKMRH